MGSSTWAQVHGLKYMGSSTWAQVHGLKYMGSSTWAQVHGLKYMDSSTWAQVHGLKYMGSSTWTQVHGLKYMGLLKSMGFNQSVGLQKGVDFHVILFHPRANLFKRLVHRVRKLNQLVLFRIDHAPAHHGAKIQHLLPIAPPVNQNHIVLREFPRLQQRHHLPKLIHRPESAGKNDQRLGNLREPQFAHEKIMKIKAQFRTDIRVRKLFVRQFNR